jgi:AcrR family transcriptional regulator
MWINISMQDVRTARVEDLVVRLPKLSADRIGDTILGTQVAYRVSAWRHNQPIRDDYAHRRGNLVSIQEGSGVVREPMARPPTTARGARRRLQILRATARVVSARGVEDTRLSDVAEEASVSIGSIQHHFASRDELLTSTFEMINDTSLARWAALGDAHDDPPRRLRSLLEFAALARPEWREEDWAIWIEFWALAHRAPRFRDQYDQIYSRWRAPFLAALADGVEQGRFDIRETPVDAVDRLTAHIEGLRIRAMLDPELMPRPRMFELLVRTAEGIVNCDLS